jgi:DNA-binding CsgD family transcriptional regulator
VAAVTAAEAMTEPCPTCHAAMQAACTYEHDLFVYEREVSAEVFGGRVKRLAHARGEVLADGRVHNARAGIIKARRIEQYEKSEHTYKAGAITTTAMAVLYGSGWTLEEVASTAELSTNTVRRRLVARGETMRSRGSGTRKKASARDKRIVAAYAANRSPRSIADQEHVTRQTVYNALRRQGVDSRAKLHRQADKALDTSQATG